MSASGARSCSRISSRSEFCGGAICVLFSAICFANTCVRANNPRFKEDGELKYYKSIGELVTPDRSTLEVNFDDIEKYNTNLATTIVEEYYRYVVFAPAHSC